MSNISVTTTQNTIEVTEVNGITVTTPTGQTIEVTVPNTSVDVTNTTDDITVLTGGTLNINSSGVITSVNGDTGPIVVLTTSDINEGTNLYYTTARANTDFDTRLATKSTTNLAEGTNLYYTTARANTDFDTRLATKSTTDLAEGTNLYYTTARANTDFDTRLATKTTDNLNEGTTNLYFTNARARSAISVSDQGGDGSVSYDNSTGVITYTGPSASEVRAHFSGGTGVTYNSGTGEISIGQDVATTDNPQFAGATLGNVTVGLDTDNTISTTTGDLVLDSQGLLQINKNLVKGIVRQSAALANGDIWGFGTGSSSPYRGISLDNYATATTTNGKRTGIVMRNIANGPRNTIISEVARGTNPSSPSTITGNTILVEFAGGGYYGGGSDGWTSNTNAGCAARFRLQSAESWTSTNTGAGIQVDASPPGPYAGTVLPLFAYTHNAGVWYCNQPTFISKQIAAGGNEKFMLDLFESKVDVGGQTLNINSRQEAGSSKLQAYAGSTAGDLTWDGTKWIVSTDLQTTGDLDVLGGDITNSTGALNITTTSNGNITLAPNGTGDVALTLADGGNLTNSRNYVFGAIRNATTESNGDIWALNAGSNTTPTRGISIDNSADTSKTASMVARTYGATPGNRSRLIFERARGTAASPTAVQVGDLLGEVDVTGYTSTGWINDTVTVVPGFFGFTATENWVSNTNIGTNFSLSMAPTATTVTSNTNLVPTIQSNPQINYFRADRFALAHGKTSGFSATGCSVSGTTLTIGTLSSGTIAVGQVLTFTTATANGIYIVANISGSGSGSTWQLSESPGTLSSQSVSGHAGFIAGSTAATTVDALQELKLVKNVIKASDGNTAITTVPITSNNPNTDFTGNIVKGAVRVGESTGDIWQFTGGSGATTGISIDNTDKVADRTALVLRNYGGSVPGAIPRNNIIFEAARGSAATPLNLNSGNILGEITANGYTSTGWVTDQVTSVPGIIRFYTTEAWNNGINNIGTGLRVILQPNATTATAGGASLVTALDVTPTSTTVQKLFTVANNRSTGSNDFAVINFSTQKFTSPNYIPTSDGDTLGEFKFNGNYSSGPTSAVGVPAAQIGAKATETWTSTANGTEFYFTATKTGTTSTVDVIQGGSDSTTFRTDTLNIRDSSDTALPGGDILYRRTYGCFHKMADITAAAADTVYNFDWYSDTTVHVGNQGVTVTSGNPTRLNIDTQGSYSVILEMHAQNVDNADRTAYIWLAKNGTDLSETCIKAVLTKDTSTIITKDWLIDGIADNDYIEVRFAVDNTSGISLQYEAAQTSPYARPAIASATITVRPIGA